MKYLRTPDECFDNLPEYPFEPRYLDVSDGEGGMLRVHYVDQGPRDANPILLMHGEPSWSFLYRKMIPVFSAEGFRVVAPDLVGFGRSDKPAQQSDYSYERHVNWMQSWLEQIDLNGITLVCQDWGGLIGLRLLASNPDRFSRTVAANTGLPTGEHKVPQALLDWRRFSQEVENFDVGAIVAMGCAAPVAEEVVSAYNAPFPDNAYKEGARIFPSLIPIHPGDPGAADNRKAWQVLSRLEKPFLTAFSDKDPITRGGAAVFQKRIPGAAGQAHKTIEGGGHFLQEDCGAELARVVLDFIRI